MNSLRGKEAQFKVGRDRQRWLRLLRYSIWPPTAYATTRMIDSHKLPSEWHKCCQSAVQHTHTHTLTLKHTIRPGSGKFKQYHEITRHSLDWDSTHAHTHTHPPMTLLSLTDTKPYHSALHKPCLQTYPTYRSGWKWGQDVSCGHHKGRPTSFQSTTIANHIPTPPPFSYR